VLLDKNISTDTVGLNKYLSGLHPSVEQQKRAERLIEQLGSSDSFKEREVATDALLVLPVLPNEALIAASQGSDPEIRWRAKKILKLGKPESERVLYAAFKTIEETKPVGMVVELLRAVPLCDKPHLRYAARQALESVARPTDLVELKRALKSTSSEVRIASCAALASAIGGKADSTLQNLLDDSDDRVRLAAARALANNGNRDSLATLVDLLSSDDKRVQTSSGMALRELSGKRFGFAAYESADKRKAAIEKWNAWIAGDGKQAKLHFPLKLHGTSASFLGGNTLLAFGGRNKVAEFDPTGKEIWTYTGAQNVWSAEKLSNGNVLIAAHSQQQVIEVDRSGKIVWQFQSNYPLNAKQLPNGNFLIADWNGRRAVEIDRQKNVIWEFKTQKQCGDIHRLDNGNTLVAIYQGNVQEVTPDGKVVWEHPGGNCYGCQPLPSGNVLITDIGGRVIEVARDKKIVWEFSESGAVDAFRLPNGNTLITGNSRFIEVTPDKKIVWSKTGASYGTARR
jgi:hypothetical protein